MLAQLSIKVYEIIVTSISIVKSSSSLKYQPNCIFIDVFIYSYVILYDIAETLKHVAKTVAHVDLSDHIIQVVYTIFDENSELIFSRNTICIKAEKPHFILLQVIA